MRRYRKIILAVILAQLIILPILLVASKQKQETRSKAAEPQATEEDLSEDIGMAEIEMDLQALESDNFQPDQATPSQGITQNPSSYRIANNPKVKKEVYGFLWEPFVNEDSDKTESYLQYPYLTTLAYAGLVLNKEGTISKNKSSYNVWRSPRLKKILTDARAQGVKIHPRIAIFKKENVTYLLETDQRRQLAVDSIMEEIKTAPVPLDGVNIDFEPVPEIARDQFTDFIKRLRVSMDSYNPGLEIVIDTYGSAAKGDGMGWDFAKLDPYVNSYFVMSFNLVSGNADNAGSRNPKKGLERVAEQYLTKVPKEKIILGFPLYTYVWPTKDNTFRSERDEGKGDGVMTHTKVNRQAEVYGKNSDDTQPTAWFSYLTCDKKWMQVYFDDERVLSEKFKIITERDLGGVGFWTFTQDQGYLNTWNAIYNSFGDKSVLPPPSAKYGFSEPERFVPECPQPSTTPKPSPSVSPIQTPTPTPSPTPRPSTPPPSPSPTQVPAGTVLHFGNVKLHGIGRGGDNTNPNIAGNQNPLRQTRSLTVEIYNRQNSLISSSQGNVVYVRNTGNFQGDVLLSNPVNTGSYIVKVKTESYLRAQLSGIITINKGVTSQMPVVTLVAGDANGDGDLSVLDYDFILDCFADLNPPRSCNPTKKIRADISDDGKVDQDDYNLFLRELSALPGD